MAVHHFHWRRRNMPLLWRLPMSVLLGLTHLGKTPLGVTFFFTLCDVSCEGLKKLHFVVTVAVSGSVPLPLAHMFFFCKLKKKDVTESDALSFLVLKFLFLMK
jgi:hypothetical protein